MVADNIKSDKACLKLQMLNNLGALFNFYRRYWKKSFNYKEKASRQTSDKEDVIQAQIDNLRSKVIEINKNIEEKN